MFDNVIKVIDRVTSAIDGYKTYIAGGATLIAGVVYLAQGNYEAGMVAILSAASALGLRSAIKKVEN